MHGQQKARDASRPQQHKETKSSVSAYDAVILLSQKQAKSEQYAPAYECKEDCALPKEFTSWPAWPYDKECCAAVVVGGRLAPPLRLEAFFSSCSSPKLR